uniref:ARAD1C20174p n=1 Tax=Blastobotrys adeninivorans TaxID=409370 RepID=A0A060T1F9_BLAAD
MEKSQEEVQEPGKNDVLAVQEAVVEDGGVNKDYAEYEYTAEEEKKVVRKMDLNIVSFVSALYLLAFLDRGNIGNANTAGMSKDLGITNKQYEWFLTIFYISYILSMVTIILWKAFPPRYYAPTVVILWGIVSTCCAAVTNWSGMMALRFFLGIFEAAFGPGVPYYLTFFYFRHEVTWRTGLFMAVAPLASCFSGALAYGITMHKEAIESWRVLFLVEGLPTIAVGFLGYFVMVNGPTECRFLSAHEKNIAVARLAKQTGGKVERSHKINFKEVFAAFTDPKALLPMVMYFGINVSFASLPVFMPAIVESLGYTSINAQGLTAPPYLFTTLCVLAAAWISDKYMQRGILIIVLASVSAAGWLILALCHNNGVKYFAIFLAAGGIFPCVALTLSWLGNNQGTSTRRGAGFVLVQAIGQCGPVLGTRLFPERDAPLYHRGFFVSFGMSAMVAVAALLLRLYLSYENRKLDEKYGPVQDTVDASDYTTASGEENTNFRYVL